MSTTASQGAQSAQQSVPAYDHAVRFRLKYSLTPDQIKKEVAAQEALEAEFDKTLPRKFLNLFPKKSRVFVGTTTLVGISLAIYSMIRPGEKNPSRTLSPEWKLATEQYQAAQNQDPVKRFKEAQRKI